MAQQPNSGSSKVKLVIVLMAILLGMYIVGPPLYWEIKESISSTSIRQPECPVCMPCDCSTTNLVNAAISTLGNFSLSECGKLDPEVRESMDKSREDMLEEELKLREAVCEDNRQRAEMALLDAKKTSSQYQKEAEKCNIGMETSEEAREKAEAALGLALKSASLWESRAREMGWTDSRQGEHDR